MKEPKETNETARNIEINDETWRKTGVLAAQLSITKKELVGRALEFYHYHINQHK